jgi:peptidoglycan/LPS O-acetylase OafA/YrhL
MTVTTSFTPSVLRDETSPRVSARRVWATGLLAGGAAAVATSSVAAVAHAAGVSLDVGGSAIPVAGFAQLTFVAAVIGTILALVLSRRSVEPQRTFVRATIVLTVLSIVPDVLVDAQVATKLTLALTHVVAAAIVIPALASRVSDR